MKKVVLIPTDFSIESLKVVKAFLNHANAGDSYDIILLHGAYNDDSITEMLFYSKTKHVQTLSNKAFEEACLVIKNKYESVITSIRKDIFSGYNQTAFNNYIEANSIDEAYIPVDNTPKFNNKKSFDITPFIKNSTLPVHEIGTKIELHVPEKGELAEIFMNQVAMN